MLSLHELQVKVLRAVLDGKPDAACGITPPHAVGVYARTARGNFIDSLKSSYPAIQRLVGEEYFEQTARHFHARHPSRSGDLQPAGRDFAHALRELHGEDEFRYLSDVARFEWLVQEALLAADHGPLDLARLAAQAPSRHEELRFKLHPSARLFESPFPCRAIWQANVASDADPAVIDLDGGADRLLMVRTCGQLNFHDLSQGERDFLLELKAGRSLSAAIDCAAGPLPFDPAAALQRFVACGVVVDFQ